MKNVVYIRVSTEQQDAEKQKHLILEYAHTHRIIIHEFMSVEMSSRKSPKDRKIDLLRQTLRHGDQLLKFPENVGTRLSSL
jgi:DNA invertase Pin-like site-specific DNA recombinase